MDYVELSEAELNRRVKAFMDTARSRDPEKCALVCSKYPVLSVDQMNHVRRREIPVGLHPEGIPRERL